LLNKKKKSGFDYFSRFYGLLQTFKKRTRKEAMLDSAES